MINENSRRSCQSRRGFSATRCGARCNGLAVYVDELILECAKAIGEPGILAGHSLGGTFATIFASLHPECVRSLILLEAPLSFSGEDAGTIANFIRIAPPTEALRKVSNYPGTLLNVLGLAASPKIQPARRHVSAQRPYRPGSA